MFQPTLTSIFFACLYFAPSMGCGANEKCAIPYTASMQKEILDYHNLVRSKVNPTASNMQKVYWDETMAKMALDFSVACVFDHNSNKDREFGGYTNIGQNLFMSNAKPTNASEPAIAWHNELRYFTYGEKSDKDVGHYTQVVRAPTARIGCGMAQCPGRKRPNYIVACHYLHGQYNFRTPYELGSSCSVCPKSCKNNLCDCNGMVCKNGGKLDLNTCQCKCIGHTSGKLCETINCNIKEKRYCPFYARFCDVKYGHKARNNCPISCKLCKKS